jgi:hypothetical protein
MPQIPPWLVPARPAPLYAQGIGLGLQAASQQQQAAYRQQALMQQAAQQQEEAMLASQRMAVQQEMAQQEMAMKSAELGISQQALTQRDALNQMKIEEASRLASAQRQYSSRVAAGEPPEKVLGEMAPVLGMDSAYAALIREQMKPTESLSTGPVQGQPLLTPEGKAVPGVTMYRGASGAYLPYRNDPELPKMTESDRIDRVLKVQDAISKLYEGNRFLEQDQPDPEWTEPRRKQWQRQKASLKFYEDQLSTLQSGNMPGMSRSLNRPVLPTPKSKAEAKAGQLYQTKFGIMEWNGQKFVAPTTSTQSDY